jgi:hypothetical protein
MISFEVFVLQVSVSTMSTKHLARSETPSSILSSDSDIRFTRKLGAHYRCGCCILAGFLLFLLLAAAAIYLGCKYFCITSVRQGILLSFYHTSLPSLPFVGTVLTSHHLQGSLFCVHMFIVRPVNVKWLKLRNKLCTSSTV